MLKNYIRLPNGTIKQSDTTKKIPYDKNYVKVRYDTYGEKGAQMAFLRLGYLTASINKIPDSILDVGYGNGDFLKACMSIVKNCYGNDISGYPIPNGAIFEKDIFSKHFEAITFYDVLEHFEEISFLKKLKTNYLVISVPHCHYISDDWFRNWKHRRENEHFYHFNEESLSKTLFENGFELINFSNIEDCIRKPTDELPNILTGTFKKII